MITDINSEDRLVQKTFANICATSWAGTASTRGTKKYLGPTARSAAALTRRGSDARPASSTGALDP